MDNFKNNNCCKCGEKVADYLPSHLGPAIINHNILGSLGYVGGEKVGLQRRELDFEDQRSSPGFGLCGLQSFAGKK